MIRTPFTKLGPMPMEHVAAAPTMETARDGSRKPVQRCLFCKARMTWSNILPGFKDQSFFDVGLTVIETPEGWRAGTSDQKCNYPVNNRRKYVCEEES